MAIELLSDTTLRSIKAGVTEYKGKQRLDDGGGLVLLLNVKGGGRAWRFNYTFAGKRKMISLGKYPDTTLAVAREKAKFSREQVAEGIDPSQARKQIKIEQQTQIAEEQREMSGLPATNSFAYVAMEWFEAREHGWSKSHSSRTLAYIEKDLIPWIGRLPIAEIEAPILLECLRRVENRGASEAANRLRAMTGQIWRYAISIGKAKRDIAADLIGALTKHKSKHFSHITDTKILGQLLRDIDGYIGTPMVKIALKVLPLVFTRPVEFRCAKWEDIDIDAKEWRYIATKTNTNHIVPLSEQVITHIKELQPLTSNGIYVFGVRGGERPLSENTINSALKTLGYSSDVIQPHGFRHTAATMLAELGWNTEAIDRQLAHKGQGVKDIYQKAQYLEERKRMMQAWSDYTDTLKIGAQIIPFKTA